MVTRTPAVRRILVALDASPGSMAALEAAARVATRLDAELVGLYVEDENLLKVGDLPIAGLVDKISGGVRPVGRNELEQHLRVQASQARSALEAVAGHLHVRWTFRVTRGGVSRELLAATAEADLVSLGRSGWSMIETRRIGSTTETILGQTATPVLLLRQGLCGGRAVVAVFDASEGAARGLDIAAQLTRDETAPLIVVLPGTGREADELEHTAREALRQAEATGSTRFRHIPRRDAALLENLARGEDAGILILPAPDVFGKGTQEVLTRIHCPVLVVR